MKKRNLSILPKFFKWNQKYSHGIDLFISFGYCSQLGSWVHYPKERDMAAALILHVGSAKKRAFVCCLVDEVAER